MKVLFLIICIWFLGLRAYSRCYILFWIMALMLDFDNLSMSQKSQKSLRCVCHSFSPKWFIFLFLWAWWFIFLFLWANYLRIFWLCSNLWFIFLFLFRIFLTFRFLFSHLWFIFLFLWAWWFIFLFFKNELQRAPIGFFSSFSKSIFQ